VSVVRVTVSRPVIEVATNAIPVVSGGTTDHAALSSNLAWATSGHTGTASRLAGFDGAGAAAYYTRTTALTFLGAVVVSATAVTTSDATNGSSIASFSLTIGKKYIIVGELAVTTASGSTAQNFRMAASGGLALTTSTASWVVVGSAFIGGVTTVDAWTAFTAGAIDRIARVAIFVDVSTGGTLTIEMRSEVGGISVESRGGGLVMWEVA